MSDTNWTKTKECAVFVVGFLFGCFAVGATCCLFLRLYPYVLFGIFDECYAPWRSWGRGCALLGCAVGSILIVIFTLWLLKTIVKEEPENRRPNKTPFFRVIFGFLFPYVLAILIFVLWSGTIGKEVFRKLPRNSVEKSYNKNVWALEDDIKDSCKLCYDRSKPDHDPLDAFCVASDSYEPPKWCCSVADRKQGNKECVPYHDENIWHLQNSAGIQKDCSKARVETIAQKNNVRMEFLKAQMHKANEEIRQRQAHEHDLLWYKLVALGVILAAIVSARIGLKGSGNSPLSIYEILKMPFTCCMLLAATVVVLLMDIRFMWNLNVGVDIGRWILEVEKCLGIGIHPHCGIGVGGDEIDFIGRLGYESWMHKDSPGNNPPSLKIFNSKEGSIFLLSPVYFSYLVMSMAVYTLSIEKEEGEHQYILAIDILKYAVTAMFGMVASLTMSFISGIGYNNWGTRTLHLLVFTLMCSFISIIFKAADCRPKKTT